MDEPLISVIMPVYNGKYVREAINSVIHQTYKNWELIIVNDGSTDNSEEEILKIADPRIKYTKQSNKGVSAARNAGLSLRSGKIVCFLDADDQLTPNSLASRLEIIQHQNADFVDGVVSIYDEGSKKVIGEYRPNFKGIPQSQLLKLSSRCFFAATWLIRMYPESNYTFEETIRHGEDLDFLVQIGATGTYSYTEKTVMIYRTGVPSAMSDLRGLEEGYSQLFRKWKSQGLLLGSKSLMLKLKMSKIIFLSYLNTGNYYSALRSIAKFIRL
ncbi:hypothetical protein MASR2M41_16150 [Flammeovirgaceae bacterium]